MKHTIAIQRESAALWHSLGGDVAEALEDPLVTDLLLNADGKLWVDRTGHGRSFTGATIDVHEANSILRLLAHNAGVPVTRDCPLVSATLPGTGERFAGTMPPTTERPTFAIRKPPAKTFAIEAFLADAADTATVTPDDESAGHPHATALTRAVAAKKNILIAGSTGSGKTSLLSCLLALPSVQADRCLVLEDTQEILIEAPDSVRMLTSSTINMRDLVRQCLRYRPDRLILGEVRGTEALDLVFALNTGHEGSFSTIHANNAEDAIARLEDLCSTAAVNVPRRAIATAFQCIAFVRRTAQGRRIEDVLNVSGFDAASGRYLTTRTC